MLTKILFSILICCNLFVGLQTASDDFVKAAARGDIVAMKKMIVFDRADINSVDSNGNTALHVAVQNKRDNVIEFMHNKNVTP